LQVFSVGGICAKRLVQETFREADIVARIGGDEFVVLAVDASMESTDILTDRIQAALKKRKQQGDQPYQLTLSLGIARYDPEAPCTVNELIDQADGRMYQQKQEKKRKAITLPLNGKMEN
jgi:diguanylate cyclase (GGDEF)-like protein